MGCDVGGDECDAALGLVFAASAVNKREGEFTCAGAGWSLGDEW